MVGVVVAGAVSAIAGSFYSRMWKGAVAVKNGSPLFRPIARSASHRVLLRPSPPVHAMDQATFAKLFEPSLLRMPLAKGQAWGCPSSMEL